MIVAAHRGLSSRYPENTLAAFRGAVEAGFDAIEMDLRLSHDKEIIVLHDANVARTTDGVGRASEMDYDAMLDLETGAGPIPRLADVLHALDAWDGLWDLELKEAAVAGPLVDLLHHRDVHARAVITSFHPDALLAAKQHGPDLERGLIVLGPPDEDDVAAAKEADCRWFKVDHAFLTPDLVARLHEQGFRVGAWTVNDVDEANAVRDAGIDLLITDELAVWEALR